MPFVPRSIHQVWLGPLPPPTAWMNTWRDSHPDWGYKLWREDDIDRLGLRNRKLFAELLAKGIYDAASDVARIEILEEHGGVYLDADSVCIRPLDDAPFLDAEFFATQELQPNGKPFVTNAFMGCVPGSEIAQRYTDHIARTKVRCLHGGEGAGFCCAWKTTGPLALTQIVRNTDAVIVEPAAFFTRSITGEPIAGTHYGEHFWSSTYGRTPAGTFVGRTYEEAV